MNMTFIHIPTPKGFERGNGLTDNLTRAMFAKEADIALGEVGTHYLVDTFLDSTSSYYIMSFSWYVPCSFKYTNWNSIFRILSVELWLVLIISIVIAAIATTLVGRYSCTSEWQVYKKLSSSLTNLWAVILGVSVSTMPRTPSLRSLFLAWVCYSVAFSTVIQAFLTTYLVGSSYKTRIQNKEILYESGSKFYYPLYNNFFFENGDETEVSKVQRHRANCPSYEVCIDWAKYHKNVSILFLELDMEINIALGGMLDDNSELFLCRLEEGEVYNYGLSMLMLQGDPLLRRFTEIIDRVVEAGLYNLWISMEFNKIKLRSRDIAIAQQRDGYYSFNLYHMQPAFFLLFMGWCLSAISFMAEFLYNLVKKK
jgi:hypothetical protein